MSRLFENRFVKRIVHINDTPEAIALGAAVGMFIGMTPTVGVQMLLVVIVGTIIRVNRLAGVVMVYISNPFTVLPIYWLDYWVGSTLLGFEYMTYEKFRETCAVFRDQLNAGGLLSATLDFVTAQGSHMAWAMTVGGVVLGVIFAIPVYPLTLQLVLAHRRHKARVKAEVAGAAGPQADGKVRVEDGAPADEKRKAAVEEGAAARADVEAPRGED